MEVNKYAVLGGVISGYAINSLIKINKNKKAHSQTEKIMVGMLLMTGLTMIVLNSKIKI